MFKNPILYIVLFALTLRLFGLSSFPVGPNPDEASQGYSAYSIIKTGLDEWGNKPPLSAFKSFLDYKAPLYTYLTIPAVAIFDLKLFSIRLPSALAGTLAVYLIYLLSNLLFPGTGIASALLLAISPWAISFSRSAMEANLLPPILFIAFYFLLKSQKTQKYLILSTFFFSLSLYAYHAAKIFVPIFILIYLLKHRKNYAPKTLCFSLLTSFLTVTPLALSMIWGIVGKRGGELLLTNLNDQQLKSIQDGQFFSGLGLLARFFYNKYTFFWHSFLDNYLTYFNPVFWFSSGSGSTSYSNLPGFGLLYFWTLPLLLIGLRQIPKNNAKYLLVLWLFIGPISAAVTKDSSHPNRLVPMMGLSEILIAAGLIKFFKRSKTYLYLFFAFCLISLSSYLFRYSFIYPIRYTNGMFDLYNQAILEVLKIESGYQKVYLPERFELQSLVAFHQRTDPKIFQNAAKNWEIQLSNRPDILYLDQLPDIALGKFNFKHLNWPEDIQKDTLYLSKSYMLPPNRNTIKVINTRDQAPFMEIFDFRYEKE